MWMFNYDFHHYGAGVFWAIGWSMVALSILVYLPTHVVTALGVAMIVLHNLLYLPCRWFGAVKQRRRDVWLSYL